MSKKACFNRSFLPGEQLLVRRPRMEVEGRKNLGAGDSDKQRHRDHERSLRSVGWKRDRAHSGWFSKRTRRMVSIPREDVAVSVF